jgi:hypothetical protein
LTEWLASSCSYSFELKRIGEAIFAKPTIDVFGRRLAVVPAKRLLALVSNALEPEHVVAHVSRLRAQLDADDPTEDERAHASSGSNSRGRSGASAAAAAAAGE